MFDVKGNFRNKYTSSSLECPLDGCSEIDTQPHLFECTAMRNASSIPAHVKYEDIFSKDLDKLLDVGTILIQLVEIRDRLKEVQKEDVSL